MEGLGLKTVLVANEVVYTVDESWSKKLPDLSSEGAEEENVNGCLR